MWFVDSLTKHITAFDYDLAAGTVSNPRVAIDFGVDASLGVCLCWGGWMMMLAAVSRWAVH